MSLKAFSFSKLFVVGFLIGIALLGLSAALSPTLSDPDFEITDQTPLWKVMIKLGKINPHPRKEPGNDEQVRQGESLVNNGYAIHEGKRSPAISSKFTCAACHISKPESKNLHDIDPDNRLKYLSAIGEPFLPGTSFYGMVNRIMFFNDDFLKRYVGPKSDLLKSAHFNLREAVDACNQVFGQGRKLKDWEKEAILAYLWTMELKMGELRMGNEDREAVQYSIKNNRGNAKAVNLMRNYYLEVYPSTLEGPYDPIERRMVSPVVSNFSNGRQLYDNSCLHCHGNKRFSKIKLDYRPRTFKRLRDNFEGSSFSIYDAHRYMPAGRNTQRPPVFTAERMSNRQLQDLRFFIQTMARMGDAALDYYKD